MNPQVREDPSEVVVAQGQPVIRAIVARRLGGSLSMGQDIEDVCSDAMLALLSRCETEPNSVVNIAAYASMVAYHACDNYFRRRFPQRHRLKNKLRYLLKPEHGLDLWDQGAQGWLCGRSQWRGRPSVPAPAEIPSHAGSLEPRPLLASLFDLSGGPIGFDNLVDCVARIWGVKDEVVALESIHAPVEEPMHRTWEHRVQGLWSEIVALPLPQRAALLLNLRAGEESSPITLFPATGAAGLGDIAAALEIPVEEFAEIWRRLPLSDLEIAGRLGGTRQQVINLRQSARRKLARNLAEAIEDISRRRK
jgi:DNA-directed RNA polymerase specialized sigma24 family protein